MRKIFHLAISTIIFTLILVFHACKKEETPQPASSSSASPTQVSMILKTGTWEISSYIDSGTDETYHFSGFIFTFSSNGKLTAERGNENYEGSWNVEHSSDDDSPVDLDLVLAFSLGNDFDELSDDWDIQVFNTTKIELKDVSGGNGGIDYLTFRKR